MKKQKSRKKWLLGLIFILGLGIFLYPNLGKIYAEYSQVQIILDYNRQQAKMDEQLKNIELEKIAAYNQSLVEDDVIYVDPFEENEGNPETKPAETDKRLGEALGHIEIPKIGIDIPIYNGTTDYILQQGIGLLGNSSLPVGGSSTHAALTGHRGLPQSQLFTDLDEMEIGDIFLIHSLAGTLAYEVKTIEVVLPHETQSLKIVPGEDLVTLITCTPYMINTHRILVTGFRTPYIPSEEADPYVPTKRRIMLTVEENKPFATVAAIGLILTVTAMSAFIIRKRRKSAGDQ